MPEAHVRIFYRRAVACSSDGSLPENQKANGSKVRKVLFLFGSKLAVVVE
jgi:hypothetical protein